MKNRPSYPALVFAMRGLQVVSALLFCTLTLLLYTENADFQAKVAYLHAARELLSVGAAALLLVGLGSLFIHDRS